MMAIKEEAILRGSALIYQGVFDDRPTGPDHGSADGKEQKKDTQSSPVSRFSSVQKAGYGPLPRMLESSTTV